MKPRSRWLLLLRILWVAVLGAVLVTATVGAPDVKADGGSGCEPNNLADTTVLISPEDTLTVAIASTTSVGSGEAASLLVWLSLLL